MNGAIMINQQLDKELIKAFNHFWNFSKNILNKNNEGFDIQKSSEDGQINCALVKKLNCIDPSYKILNVAKKNLINHKNVFTIKVWMKYPQT